MRYRFLFFLFFATFTYAQLPSFEELKNAPYSNAKDYYVHRWLKEENITSSDADFLASQLYRMNISTMHLLAQKLDDPDWKKVSTCIKMGFNDFLKSEAECQAISISPVFVANMKYEDKKTIYNNIIKLYPSMLSWMTIMLSEDPYVEAQKTGAKQFLYIFLATDLSYQKKYFDKVISVEFLNQLAQEYRFEAFVKRIIFRKNDFNNLPNVLLHIKPDDVKSYNALFYLGLNAVLQNQPGIASNFFKTSAKKAYLSKDVDRANFWYFLSSKDDSILNDISNSSNINIYSLWAMEYTNKKPDVEFLETSNTDMSGFDVADPFLWINQLNEIKKMNKKDLEKISIKFDHPNTLPHFAYIKTLMDDYKKEYFIAPYKEHMEKYSQKRQAMIQAIARQESKHIPSAVSTSFALGMMQFMPFLAKDIANQKKLEEFDTDMMFEPAMAIYFSNIHLDYLEKWLNHPLHVAYAYNGGIGFTRKMLKNEEIYSNEKYEPFLSMELISNEESKEYGKQVLANYVIYANHFGEDMSIISLLENLIPR